jgi:hypothetical protein
MLHSLTSSRRSALKVGLFGLSGLSLADVLRAESTSGSTALKKSVILIWLDGGPSQLESFDPKPEAPAEIRGMFSSIGTAIPGVRFCELVPGLAQRADRLATVRSLHHATGDHFAAAHWVLTGHLGATAANLAPTHPSVGSCVARMQGPRRPAMPAYVGLPAAQSIYIFPGYQGAAYLGQEYQPFDVQPEQKYIGSGHEGAVEPPKFLKTLASTSPAAWSDRAGLLGGLDRLSREIDTSGSMTSVDQFSGRALDMILSREARVAFDMEREDVRVRERYGNGAWGHYTCMARRLIEAGVRFVTVDMPHWDHHSNLEKGHGQNMRVMDRAVSALIDDLEVRGLLEETLVLVVGEFGRTPKINKGLPGIDPVPGRDHWPGCFNAVLAGGGVKAGQVVGSTNSKGEHPVDRPIQPPDLLATVYRLLGIDTEHAFNDFSGRPKPILAKGRAIEELVGSV